MGKRFWVGWILSYIGFALLYMLIWVSNPPHPQASSGIDPDRVGVGALIMVLPLILATVRISKLHPSSVGRYVLPALLAVLLLVVALGQGLLPDDPPACGTLANFGDPLPPECFTPPGARGKALIEATLMWAGFGLLALAMSWWRRRHPVHPGGS